MEPNKKHIRFLFCFHKKKCCWWTQNYLWDIWWKYYSH